MHRIRGKLTYSNVVASLALFLVLGGGTALAASQLEKESVGTSQLKKGAVTPAKLSKASKATLTGPRGLKGATGAQGPRGDAGAKGDRGEKGEAGIAGSALAYAKVEGTGGFVEAKNMAGAVVTNPATGHYCFSNLPFTPHNVVATPQAALSSVNVILGVFPECPVGTEVSVEAWSTFEIAATNTPFMIMFN
jgi:hypothetical protein